MSHCHLLFALTLLWVAVAQEILPRVVLPRYYKLTILTDLDEFAFYGDVEINIACIKPTKVIKLHAVKQSLEIRGRDVSVKLGGMGKPFNKELVSWTEYDTKNDFFVIHLKQDLGANNYYDLFLPFKGELTEETEGYFRSMYFDETAHTYKFLAMTKFHYNNARKAFPCFDEPDLKAVFNVRLAHKNSLTSLTNMPLNHAEPLNGRPGWIWEEYDETPPMSTYLVSYMVCHLQNTDPINFDKITLRFWGRSEVLSKFEFARSITPVIIKDLEEFFGTKFSLPKLDFVAVPSHHYMSFENWGIIPAEEGFILEGMLEGRPLPTAIVYAMTHELAHQWLGNLVSTRSWNTFWLFEALADYFSYVKGPKVYKDFAVFNSRLATSMNMWMYMDSDEYSNFVVNDPRYDSTFKSKDTWRKGVLLLRMLHLTVGDDIFRNGLKQFVNKYMYSSAGPDELWAVFTNLVNSQSNNKLGGLITGLVNKVAAKLRPSVSGEGPLLPSGVTVKMFMDTWTNQPGYPLVFVTRLSDGRVKITQERFIKTKPRLSAPKGCWLIPLTYSTAKNKRFENTKPNLWINCELQQSGVNIDVSAGQDDWVIFNNNFAGLYRVQYDEHNWGLLAEALKAPDFSGISELNRMQLVSDAISLAWAGALKFNILFNLLGYLRQETVYYQWRAVFNNLKDLHTVIFQTPLQGEYANIMKPLITPIFNKIFPEIWNYHQRMPADEGDLATELDIFDTACKWGVESCVYQVQEVYNQWMSSNADPNTLSSFPERMWQTILCNGVRYGNMDSFQFVMKLLSSIEGRDNRLIYINVLSCTIMPQALDKVLELTAKSAFPIRPDELIPTLMVVMTKQAGLIPVSSFVSREFNLIFKLVQENEQIIANIVENLAVRFCLVEMMDKLRKVITFKSMIYGMTEPQKALNRASKHAMPNIIWLRDNYSFLHTALLEVSAQTSVTVQ